MKVVPKVKITQWDAGEGDRDTGGRHEDNQRGEKHKCGEKPRPERKETKPRNGSQKKIVRNQARDAKKEHGADSVVMRGRCTACSALSHYQRRQRSIHGRFCSAECLAACMTDAHCGTINRSQCAFLLLSLWRWSIFLCCAGSRAVNCEVQLSLNATRLVESDFTEKAHWNNVDNLEPCSLINTGIFIRYVYCSPTAFPDAVPPSLPY